jgi:hypothetical protein
VDFDERQAIHRFDPRPGVSRRSHPTNRSEDPMTTSRQPTPAPSRRRTGALRWTAALLVLPALGACTDSTEVATPSRSAEAKLHAAMAADAERYVQLQLDRASERP